MSSYRNYYRQGDDWTESLELIKDGRSLIIGPSAEANTLIASIEVLLKIRSTTDLASQVVAKYRYPASALLPDFLPLTVDAVKNNAVGFAVSRSQSKLFPTGQLSAAVRINWVAGETGQLRRSEELSLPLGYLSTGETASL